MDNFGDKSSIESFAGSQINQVASLNENMSYCVSQLHGP